MMADEARRKWERKFWEAYEGAVKTSSLLGFPEIAERCMKHLVSVIDSIAEDGFKVQVVEHIKDRMLRGLVFWDLTEDEKKKLKEKQNEIHEGTDCGTGDSTKGSRASEGRMLQLPSPVRGEGGEGCCKGHQE